MLQLTPHTMKLIQAVNRKINANVRYRSDISLYNTKDYWTIAEHEGDCEDYALAKLHELMKLGFNRNDISLATCWTETKEYHAVLIVHTSEGDFCLDNRSPQVKLVDKTGYRFDRLEDYAHKKWTKVVNRKK